jgi:hypothetical protein
MTVMFVTVSTAGALAHRFSEWSPPVNLGPTVNSDTFDVCPFITRTGLSLYFYSCWRVSPRLTGEGRYIFTPNRREPFSASRGR